MAPKYRFSFDPDLAIVQIPLVEDVLYVMRLSSTYIYFLQGMRDSPRYIANMGLLIAEAAPEFTKIRPNGVVSIERVLAELILEMCPEEAMCMHHEAFVAAGIRVGMFNTDVLRMTPAEKHAACACRRCNEPLREL